MAKQHRPIDIYEDQFEDPLIDGSKGIRGDIKENLTDRNASLLDQASTKSTIESLGERSAEEDASYAEFLKDDPTRKAVGNIEAGLEGLGVPGPQTKDDITSLSTTGGVSDNWWNTFYNMIDEIDAERYKGQILEAETEIEKLQQSITGGNLNEDGVKDANEEISNWQKDIEEAQQDLIDNEHDMRDQKVADYYQAYTHQMEQQEGSNLTSYFGHMLPFVGDLTGSGEMAKDLGGAFSDITSMAASIAAPMVASGAAGMVTSSAAAGAAAGTPTGPGAAVTGLIAGGITAAGLLTSGYFQWRARDHESYAEMYGAYDERLTKIKEAFIFKNKRQPSEAEEKKMQTEARQGADSVYQQNKALMLYDLAEVALTAMPWGKGIKWLTSANKWKKNLSKVGMVGAGMFFNSVNEGREEGDQYLIKQDFITGKYDQDDLENLSAMARGGRIAKRLVSTSAETFAALPRVIMPGWGDNYSKYAPGRTNNAEFRNSVRAGYSMGFLMGGAMGGAQAVWSGAVREKDKRILGAELQDMNPFLYNYLNAERQRSKAFLYYDNFKDGKYKRMSEAVKRMDDLELRTDDTINIEEQLQDLGNMKALFDTVNGKEYSHLSDSQKRNLFYTIDRVNNYRRASSEKAMEAQTNLGNSYSEVDYEGRESGFEDALKKHHRVLEIQRQIKEWNAMGKGEEFNALPKEEQNMILMKKKYALSALKDSLAFGNNALDEVLKENPTLSKQKLKIKGDGPLKSATSTVIKNNLEAMFFNAEYETLTDPNRAKFITSSTRFKETEYLEDAGKKAIESEIIDNIVASKAVPLEGDPQEGDTVRVANPNGGWTTGKVNDKGEVVNDGTGNVLSLKELKENGIKVEKIQTEQEYVEEVQNIKNENDTKVSAEKTKGVHDGKETGKDNTVPPDVVDDNSNQAVKNAKEDKEAKIAPPPVDPLEKEEHISEEEETELEAEKTEVEDLWEITEEEENNEDKIKADYLIKKKDKDTGKYIYAVLEEFKNVARWLGLLPAKDIINDHYAEYVLNIDYIKELVERGRKSNTKFKIGKKGMAFQDGLDAWIRQVYMAATGQSSWDKIDIEAGMEGKGAITGIEEKGKIKFLSFIPLKANVLKRNGKSALSDGSPISTNINENNYKRDPEGKLLRAEKTLLAFRTKVMINISKGQPALGSISDIGAGTYNNVTGGKFSIGSLF